MSHYLLSNTSFSLASASNKNILTKYLSSGKRGHLFILIIFLGLFSGAVMADSAPSNHTHQTKEKALPIQTGKININTASAAIMASALKGIGLKKAASIVAYRTKHGAFKDIRQLKKVSGIGKSIVARNTALMSVQ